MSAQARPFSGGGAITPGVGVSKLEAKIKTHESIACGARICIAGWALTRASRRLQKDRNRRAACPLPQLSGRGILRKRAVVLQRSGEGSSETSHKTGTAIFGRGI